MARGSGTSDGELALRVNDVLVGKYGLASPRGRWLRDNFFTEGSTTRTRRLSRASTSAPRPTSSSSA